MELVGYIALNPHAHHIASWLNKGVHVAPMIAIPSAGGLGNLVMPVSR